MSRETEFLGRSEMADLIRRADWAATPLGPIEEWPQSLKTAASMVLASKFAMVIAWGPEFVFLYNDRYVPIIGSKHPAAMGRRAADIFPEVWDDLIGPLFRKATTEEAIAVDEILIPLERSGFLEEVFFELSYSPIRDESGGVGGMLAVVTETTVRVRGERELRTLRDLAGRAALAGTTEQALRDAAHVLAENPTDVPFSLCYLVDDRGERADLVASTGLALPHPLAPKLVALGAQEPWPLTRNPCKVVTGLALPGGAYPESCHSAAVLAISRPGLAHPYAYVVAGICPRRAFDDRYRTFLTLAADHIATGIANARTYEQERRRAEQLAEIDRAKTAFFSNISHEFRTPLTLMLGPTEDALASEERCLRGADLEAVHRNELRLLKLVNSLLDFARIEAGRSEPSFLAIDLARLTSDVASTFRSTVERAGLAFDVQCPTLPEPIWVDEAMWEKIVLNLVSNAFKFTFEGGIRVRLAMNGDAAELAVSDTGVGIPEAELPRVFERFHRVHGARSRSHEGSGIGLALVHDLARMHGGSVTATSRPEGGTTFRVRIPRGSAHLPKDRRFEPRALASTAVAPAAFVEEARHWRPAESLAPAGGGTDGRVLVVDDNADMRDYMRRLLSPRFDVDVASDGVDALSRIHRRAPDVIVSDIMMPRLDGFGLLQELRRREGPRIPVILVSARAGEESRVDGIEAGADDYVVKPFSAKELVARVGAQLALVRQREELAVARKKAEAANRAKDEFLAILGHELRNPLTPIKTALYLMTQRDGARGRELEIIDRQVDHMARLVDDLLDISRITSGKVELRRRVVELGPLVVRTLEVAGPMLARHEHDVVVSIEPGLLVDGDETRLAQIVTNLIANAAKYTQPQGRIDVTARRAGDAVELIVRDNGVGIAPEMVPHVFDLFAQEQRSAVHSDGGLGLGLAIVRSLVELHHGAVTAVSEGRGLGATFTVRFPAAHGSPLPLVDAAPSRDGEQLRVLIVDDNVDAAELLAESLRGMGHVTAVAFDGPEALELAARFHPQIALLDIGLPSMDGYEVARALTGSADEPSLLVAITGYGLEADRARSREAGFDAHLVKPIRVQVLRDLFAAAMPSASRGKRRARGSTPPARPA